MIMTIIWMVFLVLTPHFIIIFVFLNIIKYECYQYLHVSI